jgi:proton-dependent oligopeptide transporter, POT family
MLDQIHNENELIAGQPQNAKIPRSIPFLITNDLSERFSFFGMRSILAIFLVHQFFNPHGLPQLSNEAEAKSNAYTHAFSSLLYFTPFLGGLLADWFFGKYRVILIGAIVYTFGHFLLVISPNSLTGFTAGMMVIAFAAGAIKSCVSANVGDQFNSYNQHLMSRVYGWFYFSFNASASVSILLIPVLHHDFGPSVAFGVPGILMAFATIVFYAGNKNYVKAPPTGIKKDNFVSINFFVLKTYLNNRKGNETAWEAAENKYGAEKADAIKAIWRVMSVFIFIPVFWGLYDMNQSEWVIQAGKLNLDIGIFGIKLLASQIQVVNTLFVLVLIPLFNYVLYPLVEKLGFKITPLRKMGAGLFITALSFLVIGLLQTDIQSGHAPSVWWQIFAYFLLSAGEVLIAITGLEYAYTQSPPSMKSTMTSIFFLSYSIGTFFTALINFNIANKGLFSYFTGDRYFYLFMGIMLLFFLLFILLSPKIREKSYLAGPTPGGLQAKDRELQQQPVDNIS